MAAQFKKSAGDCQRRIATDKSVYRVYSIRRIREIVVAHGTNLKALAGVPFL